MARGCEKFRAAAFKASVDGSGTWRAADRHGAPLLAGGFERLLGEGGIDRGEDHLAFALAGIRRAVAQDETTQKELTTRSIRTQNPG